MRTKARHGRRFGRRLLQATLLASVALVTSRASADIFTWEYIGGDPNAGTQPSGVLTPDGFGQNPQTNHVYPRSINFFQGYLAFADFTQSTLYGANLGFADAHGAIFKNADLFTINLNNANLTGADLTGAYLVGANLNGATLSTATLDLAQIGTMNLSSTTARGLTQDQFKATLSYIVGDVQGLSFTNNDFHEWNLASINMSVVDMSNTNLSTANFSGTGLVTTNFSNATLTNATFLNANAAAANFTGARTFNTDFTAANLSSANFTSATFNTATQSMTMTTTDAQVASINLSAGTARGLVAQNLYDTGSYKVADLQGINLTSNDLSTWNLSGMNLTRANLSAATLGIATGNFHTNLTNANISSINLSNTTGKGFTQAQLASTQSYQNLNLRGVDISSNSLLGFDLSNQDLSYANLSGSTLSTATMTVNLNGATINYANLSNTTGKGLTPTILTSTVSYQFNHDLTGLNLGTNNLIGAGGASVFDFSSQNLSSVTFDSATLSAVVGSVPYSVNFTGATINNANFARTTARGFGTTQLYSTWNYQNHDLRGINFGTNNLGGWDLNSQNLASANFNGATLITNGTLITNFTGANLASATFQRAILTSGSLSGVSATKTDFSLANLGSANFTNADLTGATFSSATLTNANLSGATIANANFTGATSRGLTFDTIVQTKSFQVKDLHGINFSSNDISNWDLTSQNLNGASFSSATFQGGLGSGVNLGSTTIAGADFSNTTARGLTWDIFRQSDSVQDHDLHGVGLSGDDISTWDLSNQNLDSANFLNATFTGATGTVKLGGATISNANFQAAVARGFSFELLQSTASYLNHDLHGINFASDNLGTVIPASAPPTTPWDFTGQDLTGAKFNAATLTGTVFNNATIANANFTNATALGFTSAQLYSTASYFNHNLGSIGLASSAMAGWDFSGQNMGSAALSESILVNALFTGATLNNAAFNAATLINADFTGASIKNADFRQTVSRGFTPAQLMSTASYVNHDLGSIGLGSNNLSGWNFDLQDMRGTDLSYSMLQGTSFHYTYAVNSNLTNAGVLKADLFMADLRGSKGFVGGTPPTTILPNGNIQHFDIEPGISYTLHDYIGAPGATTGTFNPVPIHVTGSLTIDHDATITAIIKKVAFGSNFTFDPSAGVELGGTLDLLVDPAANVATLRGQPIYLFNWNAPLADNNHFDTIMTDPLYPIDVSNLYSAGYVTIGGLFGDTNFDGKVDIFDLLALATHFNQGANINDPIPTWGDGDFNNDGIVNDVDLGLLAKNWQLGVTPLIGADPAFASAIAMAGLPASAVPEPSTVGLGMMMAGMGLARRRRRR